MPFLAKLWAIRILPPTPEGEEGQRQLANHNMFVNFADELHEERIAYGLSDRALGGVTELPCLRYIGLGPKIWEIGEAVEEIVSKKAKKADEQGEGTESHLSDDQDQDQDQEPEVEVVYRRQITRLEEKDVQHVEIWKMDSMDII